MPTTSLDEPRCTSSSIPREPGMLSFDGALFEIYRQGRIDQQEALANAESRTNLEARINFG